MLITNVICYKHPGLWYGTVVSPIFFVSYHSFLLNQTPKSFHVANFAVNGGTASCHYNNLFCHLWPLLLRKLTSD